MRPGPFRIIPFFGVVTWSLVLLTSPAGGGCELLAAALILSLSSLVFSIFVAASFGFRRGT